MGTVAGSVVFVPLGAGWHPAGGALVWMPLVRLMGRAFVWFAVWHVAQHATAAVVAAVAVAVLLIPAVRRLRRGGDPRIPRHRGSPPGPGRRGGPAPGADRTKAR